MDWYALCMLHYSLLILSSALEPFMLDLSDDHCDLVVPIASIDSVTRHRLRHMCHTIVIMTQRDRRKEQI